MMKNENEFINGQSKVFGGPVSHLVLSEDRKIITAIQGNNGEQLKLSGNDSFTGCDAKSINGILDASKEALKAQIKKADGMENLMDRLGSDLVN